MRSEQGIQRMKFCYDPVSLVREKVEFDIYLEGTEYVGKRAHSMKNLWLVGMCYDECSLSGFSIFVHPVLPQMNKKSPILDKLFATFAKLSFSDASCDLFCLHDGFNCIVLAIIHYVCRIH